MLKVLRCRQSIGCIRQHVPSRFVHGTYRSLSGTLPLKIEQPDESPFSKFTHLSSSGDARMVSIASKSSTARVAVAVATVHFSASKHSTPQLLSAAAAKKGDILAVARVAGIQAAKQTSTIIPLCHNIPISSVEVGIEVLDGKVEINCRVECAGSTGVEMEALCGVMGAGLCVYDMCKSVDKGMRIDDVKVIEKRGGKSGDWVNGRQKPDGTEQT
jgi:molybdenum cofactor biosynthesis protein MoaC